VGQYTAEQVHRKQFTAGRFTAEAIHCKCNSLQGNSPQKIHRKRKFKVGQFTAEAIHRPPQTIHHRAIHRIKKLKVGQFTAEQVHRMQFNAGQFTSKTIHRKQFTAKKKIKVARAIHRSRRRSYVGKNVLRLKVVFATSKCSFFNWNFRKKSKMAKEI
jgi:hypothetical protein